MTRRAGRSVNRRRHDDRARGVQPIVARGCCTGRSRPTERCGGALRTRARRRRRRRDQAVLARRGRGRGDGPLNDALYRVTVAGASLDATSATVTIAFEMTATNGLTVKKTFASTRRLRAFVARRAVGTAAQPAVHWGPGLGDDIAARRRPRSSRRATTPRHRPSSTRTARSSGICPRAGVAGEGRSVMRRRRSYFAALLLNDPSTPAPLTIDTRRSSCRSPSDRTIIGTLCRLRGAIPDADTTGRSSSSAQGLRRSPRDRPEDCG